MEYIAHRINSIKKLDSIPKIYGVEIDIRDYKKKLILEHDPFKNGEDFELFLKRYKHGTLILNIKSEGIEFNVLKLLKKYKIKKYFFLDSSFPMINKLILANEKNIALRFSEFEKIDTILSMSQKVKWIWVDCFSKLPITIKEYKLIKNKKLKLCLVSPELQNQEEKLEKYKEYLKDKSIIFDAICCKLHNVYRWKS